MPDQETATARLHLLVLVYHRESDTTRILADMPAGGADIIDLDWMVDIRQAAEIFGERVALCGNFDPVAVMLQGTEAQVEAAVRCCLEHGGRCYFSAAGSEIPEGTPHANLRAQAKALRVAAQVNKR